MVRWLAVGLAIIELYLDKLMYLPFFVGAGLACIWFPAVMGDMLGRFPATGGRLFQVPESLARFIGWVFLLVPALWRAFVLLSNR